MKDEGNNNPSMYEIIRGRKETSEDEVLSLSDSHSFSIDPTGKPELFRIQIWKYVRDDDRSNVASRWGYIYRSTSSGILLSLSMHFDICKERPNQQPYVKAITYANINDLFHPNEKNSP